MKFSACLGLFAVVMATGVLDPSLVWRMEHVLWANLRAWAQATYGVAPRETFCRYPDEPGDTGFLCDVVVPPRRSVTVLCVVDRCMIAP